MKIQFHLVVKCVEDIKRRKKLKKKILDKKVFWFLFVDFELSKLSQKIQTQTFLAFWDTSIPLMSNVGSQITDI